MNLSRKYWKVADALVLISFVCPARWQAIYMGLYMITMAWDTLPRWREIPRVDAAKALVLGGLWLLYLAWLPLIPTNYHSQLINMLETRFSLFLFPWLLCLRPLTRVPFDRRILPVFVLALLALWIFIHLSWGFQYHQWPFPQHHVQYRKTLEYFGGLHPTYLGMYLVFAWAITLETDLWHPVFRKWIPGIQIALIAMLLSLLPKMSLFTLFLLSVLWVVWPSPQSSTRRWVPFIGLIILCLLTLTLLPWVGGRWMELRELGNPIRQLESNSLAMRQHIIRLDLALLREYGLFGLGPIDIQRHLDMLMNITSRFYGSHLGFYNTHNEYLNYWLSFGLGGFLFLVSILIIHIRRAWLRADRLYLHLMLILILAFLTENILARQQGVLFFSFFTIMFLSMDSAPFQCTTREPEESGS